MKNDDPITKKIKKRHSDIPQDGLFGMEPESKSKGESDTKKSAKPKTIRSTACPECTAKKVGVIKMYDRDRGMHVEILRDHDRVTRGGHRFKCPASGRGVG